MSVHRVCVQADRGGTAVEVDVVLPSCTPVDALLPAVVEMIDGLDPAGGVAIGWRLDRASGGALAESLSLTDNDVRDGDLLILTTEYAPPLGPRSLEPCQRVAAERSSSCDAVRFLPEASYLLAVLTGSSALGWAGASGSPTSLILAAASTCAAVAAIVVGGRSMPLSLAVVMLASTTGYLVVPSGPSAANVFLAAVACLSSSLIVLRFNGSTSTTLVATAALSSVLAVATVASMPAVAAGSVLATVSLVLLALAPRTAVLACRLGPDEWTDDVEDAAGAGHRMLTGLVAGAAAGAAVGAAWVAVAGIALGATEPGAITFTALIGAVLLLRARTYVDAPRQLFLASGGLVSCVASFGIVGHAHPGYLSWSGAAVVAIGIGVALRPRFGDAVSRLADRVEYVALVAVVPLACWVSGAHVLMQQAHVP